MPHRKLPDHVAASDLFGALGFGDKTSDRAFDGLLPDDLRTRSALHWTPLTVASRAAEWIEELGIGSVVDIGSGVGKFCVAAALAGKATYTGIEQRARLVNVARKLAETLDLSARVSFIHGTLGVSDIPSAEAYYMYNPFGENLFGPKSQIDGDVELNEARYRRDISAAERLLTEAPLGTFLITYNGFGGHVPPTFRELRAEQVRRNELQIWQKTGVMGLRLVPSSGNSSPSDAT